jgi:hypothetical protein
MACVQTFQRSSSCVEGRNGQLALRHHSFHRLSPRKLQALTTIHNFFLTRPDGSTAASSRSEPSLGLQALSFRYRLTYPMTETMIEAIGGLCHRFGHLWFFSKQFT